ncbi:hypothetical protein RLW55_03935 [Hyphomicrobium sp. B1]|jgi:hypothetical protein|uniref:hypothetical protein n=1 Tax=unclassified Hyphomicrobium TaxID=2619925 RepID=UPI0039199E44
MRTGILAAALVLGSAVQAHAQQSVSPAPTGGTESIIRTPSSSNNGSSYGTSGNVGAPTSMYPQRLQNYNNPAASYGRFGNPVTGNTRMRSNRR